VLFFYIGFLVYRQKSQMEQRKKTSIKHKYSARKAAKEKHDYTAEYDIHNKDKDAKDADNNDGHIKDWHPTDNGQKSNKRLDLEYGVELTANAKVDA
jgi:hypothetical protein